MLVRKEKVDKLDLRKKILNHIIKKISKVKHQPTEWKKMFANYPSEEGPNPAHTEMAYNSTSEKK